MEKMAEGDDECMREEREGERIEMRKGLNAGGCENEINAKENGRRERERGVGD